MKRVKSPVINSITNYYECFVFPIALYHTVQANRDLFHPDKIIRKTLKNSAKKREPKITTLKQAKRIIKIVTGFTVLLIGIAGLFLPFLQGIVTIILGLAILGTEFVWAKRLMRRFEDGANNIKNSVLKNKT